MSTCVIQESGAIELYYYGELEPAEHARVTDHLRGCRECAEMLRELKMIRVALAERPDVAAPPSGDWSRFMARLDAAVRHDGVGQLVAFAPRTAAAPATVRRSLAGFLAMAALLALVTLSVFVASRAGRAAIRPAGEVPAMTGSATQADAAPGPVRDGLASVGLRHLERSKLVVLGIASKEDASSAADWQYERELATGLLNDTRLYRMAAEERGLTSLASVMKDLELVLLQASMAETTDETALPQIQRLIHKRGLVQKMDVVGTTGLLP